MTIATIETTNKGLILIFPNEDKMMECLDMLDMAYPLDMSYDSPELHYYPICHGGYYNAIQF